MSVDTMFGLETMYIAHDILKGYANAEDCTPYEQFAAEVIYCIDNGINSLYCTIYDPDSMIERGYDRIKKNGCKEGYYIRFYWDKDEASQTGYADGWLLISNGK